MLDDTVMLDSAEETDIFDLDSRIDVVSAPLAGCFTSVTSCCSSVGRPVCC